MHRIGVVIVFITGCGSVVSPGDAGDAGDTGDAGDAATAGSSASAFISIIDPYIDGTLFTNVGASIGGGTAAYRVGCEEVVYVGGGCVVTQGPPTAPLPAPDPPCPQRASAGTITVMGPHNSVSFVPPYNLNPPSPLELSPGDEAQFQATGGIVPAFSGSIQFPAPLQGATASVPSGGTLDRTVALTASWTPASSRVRMMVQRYSNGDGRGSSAQCDFDGSAGSGAVPPNLLAYLFPGSAFVSVVALTHVTSGSANLGVNADVMGGGLAWQPIMIR